MLQERKIRFQAGEWTIDPELNALRRDDMECHIEPKVMKVLLTLASQQNHVFSKEELISAVWPDTFVSDDALTRCISILRRITEDDPHEPHFIQTVPKVGYRLVAPISEVEIPELDAPGRPALAEPEPEGAAEPGALTHAAPDEPGSRAAEERTRGWIPWAGGFVLFLLVAAAAAWLAFRPHGSGPDSAQSFRTVSLTGDAGEQTQPAFSPDGRSVAFVQISEDGSSRRIQVKRIGSESVRELTHDVDQQFSPAWSPDGRQIVYLASSPAGLGIYIAAVDGKTPPRRVFIPQEPSHWEQGALSWSPDGKSLIFPDHPGTAPSSSIFRLDLATLREEPITFPPAGWEGDLNPAYSPDGSRIAFTRASETAVRDIYWISLKDGSLHQLTHDRMNIESLAWSRDGQSILFSSNRAGEYALWQIALSGKEPQRLPFGVEDAFQPAVNPRNGELAYTEGSAIWSIDRILPRGAPEAEAAVLASTQQDSAPSLSPDDRWIAFQSTRSGTQEIWIASITGDSLRQLTFSGGPVTGSPSWSHNGDRILFDSRPDGHSHIFSVAAAGGPAKQLTFGNVNDIVPHWSNNDQTVYFRSNRGGRWQIWRVSAQGGEPQPVTTGDGIAAQQSPDGKFLYYTRGDEPGIWRVPIDGGQEIRILTQPAAGYWGYFHVAPEAIYYLDLSHTPGVIRLYKPQTDQSTVYAALRRLPPLYQGLTTARNGRFLLITGERDAGRHITLVEHSSAAKNRDGRP